MNASRALHGTDVPTDVVLVNALCDQPGKRVRIEHLGLGYLAAVLGSSGLRVRVVDAAFYELDAAAVARLLQETPSAIAGFSLFLNNVGETLRIVDLLRASGDRRHITLGGHHATFNYQEILASVPTIDSVVLGEGEEPLLDLTREIVQGAEWRDIPGVAHKETAGPVVAKACRTPSADLDALPLPDREPYAELMRLERRATVLSSRGCYGACSFCSIRAFYRLAGGKPWRGRSAQSVVDEIEELVKRYGVRHIEFADDNLMGTGQRGKERARAIGEEIIRRRLDVEFFFICRANDVDAELFAFLKGAGLKGVDVGVESWVPRQLALYNKRLTVDENRRAVETLKRLELISRFYVIPSDPYASPDELLANLNEVEHIGLEHFPDSAAFNRLTVFKGSPIEAQIRGDGLLCTASSGAEFNGALRYRFVHPIMARVHETGEVIYRQYGVLSQRLAAFLGTPSASSVESELGRQLDLALRKAVFSAFRTSVESCARSPEAEPDGVEDALRALDRDVAAVERLHQEGAFRQFADVTVKLGNTLLSYPPEPIRQLARLLNEKMREGDSLGVADSPR